MKTTKTLGTGKVSTVKKTVQKAKSPDAKLTSTKVKIIKDINTTIHNAVLKDTGSLHAQAHNFKKESLNLGNNPKVQVHSEKRDEFYSAQGHEKRDLTLPAPKTYAKGGYVTLSSLKKKGVIKTDINDARNMAPDMGGLDGQSDVALMRAIYKSERVIGATSNEKRKMASRGSISVLAPTASSKNKSEVNNIKPASTKKLGSPHATLKPNPNMTTLVTPQSKKPPTSSIESNKNILFPRVGTAKDNVLIKPPKTITGVTKAQSPNPTSKSKALLDTSQTTSSGTKIEKTVNALKKSPSGSNIQSKTLSKTKSASRLPSSTASFATEIGSKGPGGLGIHSPGPSFRRLVDMHKQKTGNNGITKHAVAPSSQKFVRVNSKSHIVVSNIIPAVNFLEENEETNFLLELFKSRPHNLVEVFSEDTEAPGKDYLNDIYDRKQYDITKSEASELPDDFYTQKSNKMTDQPNIKTLLNPLGPLYNIFDLNTGSKKNTLASGMKHVFHKYRGIEGLGDDLTPSNTSPCKEARSNSRPTPSVLKKNDGLRQRQVVSKSPVRMGTIGSSSRTTLTFGDTVKANEPFTPCRSGDKNKLGIPSAKGLTLPIPVTPKDVIDPLQKNMNKSLTIGVNIKDKRDENKPKHFNLVDRGAELAKPLDPEDTPELEESQKLELAKDDPLVLLHQESIKLKRENTIKEAASPKRDFAAAQDTMIREQTNENDLDDDEEAPKLYQSDDLDDNEYEGDEDDDSEEFDLDREYNKAIGEITPTLTPEQKPKNKLQKGITQNTNKTSSSKNKSGRVVNINGQDHKASHVKFDESFGETFDDPTKMSFITGGEIRNVLDDMTPLNRDQPSNNKPDKQPLQRKNTGTEKQGSFTDVTPRVVQTPHNIKSSGDVQEGSMFGISPTLSKKKMPAELVSDRKTENSSSGSLINLSKCTKDAATDDMKNTSIGVSKIEPTDNQQVLDLEFHEKPLGTPSTDGISKDNRTLESIVNVITQPTIEDNSTESQFKSSKVSQNEANKNPGLNIVPERNNEERSSDNVRQQLIDQEKLIGSRKGSVGAVVVNKKMVIGNEASSPKDSKDSLTPAKNQFELPCGESYPIKSHASKKSIGPKLVKTNTMMSPVHRQVDTLMDEATRLQMLNHFESQNPELMCDLSKMMLGMLFNPEEILVDIDTGIGSHWMARGQSCDQIDEEVDEYGLSSEDRHSGNGSPMRSAQNMLSDRVELPEDLLQELGDLFMNLGGSSIKANEYERNSSRPQTDRLVRLSSMIDCRETIIQAAKVPPLELKLKLEDPIESKSRHITNIEILKSLLMNPESARAIHDTVERHKHLLVRRDRDSPIASMTPAGRIGGNQVIHHNQVFKNYMVCPILN